MSKTNSSISKLVVRLLWLGGLGGLALIVILLLSAAISKLPTFEDLENPTDNLATEVISSDGIVLGRYFTENRVPVDYQDISQHTIDALVATEDIRFYRHSGIDFRALGRVLFRTVLLQDRSGGGGSTITQQLAKLLFTDNRASNIFERGFQKLKEWITAVRLERSYTKEEIVTMYLNEFDFLYQANGIRAASETYFGKTPQELSITESATLVGMLKNPSAYNPRRNPENALRRRNVVLNQMKKYGKITASIRDSLIATPIDVSSFQRASHDAGLAPYFRAEAKKLIKSILAQKEYFKPDGTPYNLERDGLKIYTTIDSRMQAHAEAAVSEHMNSLQQKFFKHWSWGKNPWNYGTDESFKEVKQLSLNYLMMSTTRFQSIKEKHIDGELDPIHKKFEDVEFTPYTLEILEGESRTGETLDNLVKEGTMTRKRSEYIRGVVQSKEWKELMPKWVELKEIAEAEFRKKRKMKVFSYDHPITGIDTIMSPWDSLMYHRMILQCGVVGIEPGSGQVKAWVGGVNFRNFKQDHVTVNRQVGSTFKPFIYTTAIHLQGISPCLKVKDVPYTIGVGEGRFNLTSDWSPKNSDGKFEGDYLTLYEGLRESKNSVSVFLMKQLSSVEPVLQMATNFGIDAKKIPPVPSICLGVSDLNVLEMTSAYATFANNGVHVEHSIISRITDANGKLIFRSSSEENAALEEDANYVMVDMLKKAAAGRPGVNRLRSEHGGKTGTTNDQTDGWYMGITPNLVVGVWVGGEDRWIRFRTIDMGQGSTMARPVFAKMMYAIENDDKIDLDTKKRFYKPSGELDITIDCELYDELHRKPLPVADTADLELDFFEG